MLNSSKKIYLDGNVIHDKKLRAGISPGNNAVDLGKWIEKSVESGAIDLTTVISNIVGNTSSISLNDLTDVTISTPADRSNLTYYSTINKFVASPITNITEGTLQVATADRIINLGSNNLTIDNVNSLNINSSGINQILTDDGSTLSRVRTTLNYAYLYAQSTNYSSQISAHDNGKAMLYSNVGFYQIGTTAASLPTEYSATSQTVAPLQLLLNPDTHKLHRIDSSAEFLASNLFPINRQYSPDVNEVKLYLTSLTTAERIKNLTKYFYYNGTTFSSLGYSHVYYMTGDEQLIEVFNARPKEIIRFSISKMSITTSDVGTIVGSISIPDSNLQSAYMVYWTEASCARGTTTATGQNTMAFSVKDVNGNVMANLTLDAFSGLITSTTPFLLNSHVYYLEVASVTGTIEALAMNFEIQ